MRRMGRHCPLTRIHPIRDPYFWDDTLAAICIESDECNDVLLPDRLQVPER